MNKALRHICILLFFASMLPEAVAQTQMRQTKRDSLRALRDTMNIYAYNRQALLEDGIFIAQHIDTSMHFFQINNPITRKYGMILTDNFGRPFQPAFFEPDSSRGFTLGPSIAQGYLYRGGERPYYKTKRPYTELGYSLGTAGQKKENRSNEQTLYLIHTQPISQYVQAGFEVMRITSVGYYLRQWAAHTNVRAFASYNSPNDRYGIVGDFILNDVKVQENGGLTNAVNFREQEVTNYIDGQTYTIPLTRKFGYPINLQYAEGQQQTYELFVKQFYRVGVKSYQPDSNAAEVKLPLFQVDNMIRIRTDRRRYIDSLANDFYANTFLDTTKTFHRVYHRHIDTDIEFSFFPYRKKGLANKISAGVAGSVFDVQQAHFKDANYNVSVFSRLNFYIDSLRYVRAFAEYHLLGYNQNDLNVKASLHIGFNNKQKKQFLILEPGVLFKLQEPGYLYQTMYSNRFMWNNSFRKVRTLGVYTDLILPQYRLKVKGGFYNVGNLLYYDSLGMAGQSAQETVIFQVVAEHDLAFSKNRFHFVNRLIYQTANSQYLRIAPFALRSSFFYENYLFKKALFLQVGFDIYYGIGYNGYGYNPATASFFLQNDARIGNYPYVDVHISAKIKRFRVFVQGVHLNQGFPKPNYFTTSGYPMQDRSIKFGISWGLFN